MIKLKTSKRYDAIQSRIKKIPALLDDIAYAVRKRDAMNFIRIFKEGIKNDDFGLDRLHPFTKQRKSELGMPQPSTPLYGKGEGEKNSLSNVLRLRKVKNGWKVYKSWAKHHTANLTLRHLLAIHENGCIIQVTSKMRAFLHFIGLHLKQETDVIRIPPRPAYAGAGQFALSEISRKEEAAEVRKAISIYIDTGDMTEVDKFRKLLKRADYET
jgi:hypothetical protein